MSVTKYKIFESEKKVSDANVGILISKACPSINARHLSRTDCPTNGVTGHKMAKCQGFINLNGSSIQAPSQIHIDQNVLEAVGLIMKLLSLRVKIKLIRHIYSS